MSLENAGAQRRRYRRNIEKGRCGHCGSPERPLVTKVSCQKCRAAVLARAKTRWLERKEMIYDQYGRACVCCGETTPMFLTLDHVNNDGRVDRKANPGASTMTYVYREWKRTGKWRADMQMFCWNCNMGKSLNAGVCPHKSET